MPVGHLGPDEVVTVGRDTGLIDVARTLDSENVGAVVVVEDDEPVGIVTDRDITLALAESDDVRSLTAEDVMSADPVTLREDAEGMEISEAIGDANVRRIPVVDEDGKLTGIVTLDDLVATIGEQLDRVADTIEAQSPKYRP